MPIYDYQCEDCGEVFEVRAMIKEKEAGLELTCPTCGSHVARQMLTNVWMMIGGKEISLPGCGPNCGPGCCG